GLAGHRNLDYRVIFEWPVTEGLTDLVQFGIGFFAEETAQPKVAPESGQLLHCFQKLISAAHYRIHVRMEHQVLENPPHFHQLVLEFLSRNGAPQTEDHFLASFVVKRELELEEPVFACDLDIHAACAELVEIEVIAADTLLKERERLLCRCLFGVRNLGLE